MSSRPLEELSDRELDELVAERVLQSPKPTDVHAVYPNGTWLIAAQFGITEKHPGWRVRAKTDPNNADYMLPYFEAVDFLGDISAAMEVVEKMRADGWGFKLDWTRREEALAIFRFKKNETILKFEHAFNNRVERAIVLAALRAMGVEEVQGPSAQGHDLG